MPWLADKISRKWALSVVVCIFNLGAIIQTAAPDYGTLVAGRTIGGIGVGTLALGAPLYISEISPPNLRGALLVLESVSIVSGVVIAYCEPYSSPIDARLTISQGSPTAHATWTARLPLDYHLDSRWSPLLLLALPSTCSRTRHAGCPL